MWKWNFETKMKEINVEIVLNKIDKKRSLIDTLKIIRNVLRNDNVCGIIYDLDYEKRLAREKIKKIDDKIYSKEYKTRTLIKKDINGLNDLKKR